jgi:hypothetical protein
MLFCVGALNAIGSRGLVGRNPTPQSLRRGPALWFFSKQTG